MNNLTLKKKKNEWDTDEFQSDEYRDTHADNYKGVFSETTPVANPVTALVQSPTRQVTWDADDEERFRQGALDLATQANFATDTEDGARAYVEAMLGKKTGGDTTSGTGTGTGTDTDTVNRDAFEKLTNDKKKSGATLSDMFDEYLNSKYYQNAVVNARNLAENVLGQYSSRTGGMANSYAVQAATGASENSIRDVENQLWNMARDDKQTQTNKYTQMIDYMLDNGAKPEDIPAAFYEMSGYDRGWADFKANNYTTTKDQDEAKAVIQNLLSSNKEPSEDLIARSGWSKEYVDSLKKPGTTQTSTEIALNNSKDSQQHQDNISKMYESGDVDGLFDYIDSIKETNPEMAKKLAGWLDSSISITDRRFYFDEEDKKYHDDLGTIALSAKDLYEKYFKGKIPDSKTFYKYWLEKVVTNDPAKATKIG